MVTGTPNLRFRLARAWSITARAHRFAGSPSSVNLPAQTQTSCTPGRKEPPGVFFARYVLQVLPAAAPSAGDGMGDSDDDDGDDAASTSVTNLIAGCAVLKAGGNEHFKAGRCDEAVAEYQKAVDKLTSAPAKSALAEFFKASPDAPDTASPLLASLHGNMAACHVKASQWESAISAASAALKLEPGNLKARPPPMSTSIARAAMPCTRHAHAVPCARAGALPARARLQQRQPARRGQGRPDRRGARRPDQPRGTAGARGSWNLHSNLTCSLGRAHTGPLRLWHRPGLCTWARP